MPVRGRAKNAFHQVVENAVVIVLFINQRVVFMLAFNRTAKGMLQRARLNFIFRQVILRARPDDFRPEYPVICRTEHHDRQTRDFEGELRDLEQTGGVCGWEFKQNGVV